MLFRSRSEELLGGDGECILDGIDEFFLLAPHRGKLPRNSLHMQGKAIDVRFSEVASEALRDYAIDLQAGGVGFYPDSDFVHLDTGRVRTW